MAGTCPWCNRCIGALRGAYNTIETRPGHAWYREAEAKQYLKGLVDKYEQNLKAGYTVTGANAEWQMYFFKTRPVSWRLIRQFIHVPMYFFLTVGGETPDQFR